MSFFGNAAVETGGKGAKIRVSMTNYESIRIVGCLVKGLNKEDISSTWLW